MGEVQKRLVEDDDLPGPHARAEFAGAEAVVFAGGAADGKAGQEGLQIQAEMALGGGLAAAVLGPVPTAGDEWDGGGVHEVDGALEAEGELRPAATAKAGVKVRDFSSTPVSRASWGTRCVGIRSQSWCRRVNLLRVGWRRVVFFHPRPCGRVQTRKPTLFYLTQPSKLGDICDPNYECYYSVSRHQYAYREGNAWVSRSAPRGISENVLRASPSVKMNFHDSPAQHHTEVVKQYPKNWKPSGENQGQSRKDDRRDDNRGKYFHQPQPQIERNIMLGTILLVLLVLMLLGALPTWPHSRTWGYYPSGGLGLVAVILLVLLLLGRI